MLSDPTAGTKTRYALPQGNQASPPSFLADYGSKGPGLGQIEGAQSLAVNSSGDIYVTE